MTGELMAQPAAQLPEWMAYALAAGGLLATPRALIWLLTRPLPGR